MLNQSFRQVFVSNIPTLLPSGKTVENIAPGQIGILDAKTHLATTAPTYGTNKALKVVWGTLDLPDFLANTINQIGGPNQNEYSKLVKGKLVRKFRGKKASRGQHQVVTVGWSGSVSDNDTLFSKPGEQRELFLNLTGDAVTQEFSIQGLQKRFYFKDDIVDDCVDVCGTVDCTKIAENLAKQINQDKDMSKYVKATVLTSCSPSLTPPTATTYYVFKLEVADARDNESLGLVQAQYPDFKVTRIGINGLNSVYHLTRPTNTTPTAYSNAGNIVIPDCDVCPAGYTLINQGFAYKVQRADAGDAAALTAIATEFGIDGTENVSRVAYEFGQSTYVISSDTALTSNTAVNEVQSIVATGGSAGDFTLTFDGETTAAIAYNANAAAVQSALEALSNINPGDITVAGGPLPTTPVTVTFRGRYAGTNVPTLVVVDNITGGNATVTTPTPGVAGSGLILIGSMRHTCLLNSATTVAWAADGTVSRVQRPFRITLADDVCGNDRLTALQAAYPDLVITLVSGAGSCVHTYEATVLSAPIAADCGDEIPIWTAPTRFEGASWIEVLPAAIPSTTVCKCGIRLEVAVVNRTTNEATFQYFSREADAVYLEVSSGNADYNSQVPLENFWSVKYIQGVKFPIGEGSYIQKFEKDSQAYALKFRDDSPVLRDMLGAEFQAKSGMYYDEYVLEFDFSYLVGGWSEKYTDTYSLFVYFPEGKGKAFETAINGYLASAGIDIDPVVL